MSSWAAQPSDLPSSTTHRGSGHLLPTSEARRGLPLARGVTPAVSSAPPSLPWLRFTGVIKLKGHQEDEEVAPPALRAGTCWKSPEPTHPLHSCERLTAENYSSPDAGDPLASLGRTQTLLSLRHKRLAVLFVHWSVRERPLTWRDQTPVKLLSFPHTGNLGWHRPLRQALCSQGPALGETLSAACPFLPPVLSSTHVPAPSRPRPLSLRGLTSETPTGLRLRVLPIATAAPFPDLPETLPNTKSVLP